MKEFTVHVTLQDHNGKLARAERTHISTCHTATLGWCIGETMAGALASLRDCMVGPDNVLSDAAKGFADRINELQGDES